MGPGSGVCYYGSRAGRRPCLWLQSSVCLSAATLRFTCCLPQLFPLPPVVTHHWLYLKLNIWKESSVVPYTNNHPRVFVCVCVCVCDCVCVCVCDCVYVSPFEKGSI